MHQVEIHHSSCLTSCLQTGKILLFPWSHWGWKGQLTCHQVISKGERVTRAPFFRPLFFPLFFWQQAREMMALEKLRDTLVPRTGSWEKLCGWEFPRWVWEWCRQQQAFILKSFLYWTYLFRVYCLILPNRKTAHLLIGDGLPAFSSTPKCY